MGVTLAGFGVSPFVTAPLAELLIRRFGVSQAMVILGAAFAGIVWLLSPLLRRRDDPEESLDERFGDSSRDGERAKSVAAALQRRDVKPADMLRSPRFYGLWVCYVFGTLAGLTAIGMTASFGQEAVSITATAAAAAVSAFGILNGVGRPLFGAIHDTIGTRLTVVIAFALISLAAATSLLAAGGSVVFFYVGFGIFWLMLGGWLAIAPAATVRLFGARYYGRNYGIMYTAYGLGALAGGFVAGALHTRHGSFAPLFIFVIGLCAAGIVVALLTLPGRRGA
jgi:OFA family oxalate/formate antiporter-like MFS transporter